MHGGKRHTLGGSFFEPTVLADVNPQMLIAREETFGPVAPLFRFETDAEAIAMANDTEFGLASYFYSRDIGRVLRVAEALEYGIVGINTGLISTRGPPFGGMKESAWAARARNTGSRTISRSSTCAWAASKGRESWPAFPTEPSSIDGGAAQGARRDPERTARHRRRTAARLAQ